MGLLVVMTLVSCESCNNWDVDEDDDNREVLWATIDQLRDFKGHETVPFTINPKNFDLDPTQHKVKVTGSEGVSFMLVASNKRVTDKDDENLATLLGGNDEILQGDSTVSLGVTLNRNDKNATEAEVTLKLEDNAGNLIAEQIVRWEATQATIKELEDFTGNEVAEFVIELNDLQGVNLSLLELVVTGTEGTSFVLVDASNQDSSNANNLDLLLQSATTPINPDKSTAKLGIRMKENPSGTAKSAVTLTLKDKSGNQIAEQTVQWTAYKLTIEKLKDFGGNQAASYTIKVEHGDLDPLKLEVKLASTNGVNFGLMQRDGHTAGTKSDLSTLVGNAATIKAGDNTADLAIKVVSNTAGAAESAVTLTLKDKLGNQIAEQTVQWTARKLIIEGLEDFGGNKLALFTIKTEHGDLDPAEVNIEVTSTNGVDFSLVRLSNLVGNSVNLKELLGAAAIKAGNSTAHLAIAVVANTAGAAESAVTLTLKDELGNQIAEKAVQWKERKVTIKKLKDFSGSQVGKFTILVEHDELCPDDIMVELVSTNGLFFALVDENSTNTNESSEVLSELLISNADSETAELGIIIKENPHNENESEVTLSLKRFDMGKFKDIAKKTVKWRK